MSVSELTLGLRATPFKISSSSLSSGSFIKVQSAYANYFLGNDQNIEALENLETAPDKQISKPHSQFLPIKDSCFVFIYYFIPNGLN